MEMDWGDDGYAATGATDGLGAPGGAAESPNWGDGSQMRDGYAELYPATSKHIFVGLLLLAAGISILINVALLNGIVNDEDKLQGIVDMWSKQDVESDKDALRSGLQSAIWLEVIAAILTFTGGIFALMKRNYIIVVVGCVAALVGMGLILTATLLGAAALWILQGSRHEFGIIDEEGW